MMKNINSIFFIIVFAPGIFCGPINDYCLYPQKTGVLYFMYAENYIERDVKYDTAYTWFWKNLLNRPAHLSSGLRQNISMAFRIQEGPSVALSADYVSQKINGYDYADSREISYNFNEFQGIEFSVSYGMFGMIFTGGYGLPLFTRDYSDNRLYVIQPGHSVFSSVSYSIQPWILELEAYMKAEFFITKFKREFMEPVNLEYSGGCYAGISFYKDDYQKAGAGIGADLFSEDAADFQSLKVLLVPQARVEFASGLTVMAGAEVLYFADSIYDRQTDKVFYTAKIIYAPQLRSPQQIYPDSQTNTINGETFGK